MNIKAVIFDMDGVLVDSEVHWKEKEKELYGQFDIDFEDVKEEIMGKSLTDIIDVLHKHNPNISVGKLRGAYYELGERVYGVETNLLPGAEVLLESLFDQGVRMGVGSSSPCEWIDIVVERFKLGKYFEHLYSVETMGLSGKPDPAVYVKLMLDMGVSPKEAAVIEDSIAGVRAAKASGAYTIAVPDDRWCSGDYSVADKVVESLEDVRDFLL